MSATEALRGSALTRSRTTTAPTSTSRERPTDLGGDAVAARARPERRRRRACSFAARSTASRGRSRRSSTSSRTARRGGARPARRDAGRSLPLAPRRRRHRLRLARRPRGLGHRGLGRRRLRVPARSGRARLARVVGRLRDLPRPLRVERRGVRRRRDVGGAARLGPAAGGPRQEHVARVVRRRPARASSSTSTTSRARRERHLHDAVLPGRQHAPLRRVVVRPRRPAARRRRGAAFARRARRTRAG